MTSPSCLMFGKILFEKLSFFFILLPIYMNKEYNNHIYTQHDQPSIKELIAETCKECRKALHGDIK